MGVAMPHKQSKDSNTKPIDKLYVLDTNVLIHDPEALFAFQGAHVGLPITIIQELDHFKGENSQRGRNAREVIRSLDKVREQGSLADGVKLDDGTFIQILALSKTEEVRTELDISQPDNKIIADALAMQNKGHEVHFITKDLNMRIKADALGLHTQDYKKETVAEDNFYKGWITIPVSAVELTKDEPKILYEAIEQYDIVENQFILLQGKRHDDHYRIFRYLGNQVFKSVNHPKLRWPIAARNAQQLMALDLLLDDSIQLISLFGPAGTGKTFLALVAGLHKLLIEHIYQKVLVARPVVPLGRDIGYLPGDIQEKLYSWMQPVRDNMEFIMHKAHGSAGIGDFKVEDEQHEGEHSDRGRKKGGKHHHKKGRRHGGSGSSVPSLDDLVRADKVNLEAITYMRGRSIPYQYILIDEVQNLTPHEVKTLVTRVGEGSKIILAGDPYQIDSPYLDFASNGLVTVSERFRGQSIFGTVFLETSERSELSHLAAELL